MIYNYTCYNCIFFCLWMFINMYIIMHTSYCITKIIYFDYLCINIKFYKQQAYANYKQTYKVLYYVLRSLCDKWLCNHYIRPIIE